MDLIDRQAAISALGEEPEVWMDDDDYTLGQRNQWRYDVTALKAVPSAQTERKKGKWVRCDTDGFRNMRKCSECGARIDIHEEFRSFFCYHCGADMRGEQDETNVIT